MSFFKKIGKFFLDLTETIVMALSVFVVIYLFLFQPHQVRGNSMYPNFHDGEYILTDKITYRMREPRQGDVIVFRAPKNEEYDYIKRIIAVPGDCLTISNGKVYINNQLFPEPYLPSDYVTNPGSFIRANTPVCVPPANYLVMGDNRSHSSDSREWGFVPRQNIIGRAWFRYWPPSRWGPVDKIDR
ncbi:MAG: signal peptidase I [Microgenomates group bacterium]